MRPPRRVKAALCRAVLLAALAAGQAQRAWAEAGAEHGGGQHDPTLVWKVLNFALLLVVLWVFGRKPVQEMFRERRSKIQADLDAAAEKLRLAEARHNQLQRQLQRLDEELERIRATARTRAEQEREQLLADARTAAERIRNDAQAAIQQEAQRAREALRGEAAELALSLAGERLAREVGESDRERLMDEFITRIEAEPSAQPGSGR